METNKLLKNVLWGVSALIGFVVAEGVYRAGIKTIDKPELIGDGKVLSDKIEEVEETDELIEDDIPF